MSHQSKILKSRARSAGLHSVFNQRQSSIVITEMNMSRDL